MIVQLILNILAFAVGILAGYDIWGGRNKQPKSKQPDPEESNEILVRRVRPSFRNPGKTSVAAYDSYKASNGLYAPVRQGKGSTADEVEKK